MRFFTWHAIVGSKYETEFQWVDPVFGEAPVCPKCGSSTGLKPWLPPHRVELFRHGSIFGDAAYGAGYELLVTERFRFVWERHSLRGLSIFSPVDIVRIRPRSAAAEAPTYLHVVPSLTNTSIDDKRSRLIRSGVEFCEVCKAGATLDAINGFYIAEETWKGEDVFLPRGLSGTVVVTERFANAVEKSGLVGINLTPVEKYRWDPLGKLSRSAS
jgi:hypothetical protein